MTQPILVWKFADTPNYTYTWRPADLTSLHVDPVLDDFTEANQVIAYIKSKL